MKLVELEKLRVAVTERLTELKLKPADIIKEANERGMKITPSGFSKYKAGKKGAMTDEQILWVACYLYIPISIKIGEPSIDKNIIKYNIPKYDKVKALQLLTNIFGSNG